MATHKILVVDDEHTFAEFAKMILELSGYEALVALGGHKALDLARSENPDLIIMDMSMEGLSGAETIKKLKSDPQTMKIPVILCSMSKSRAEIREALDDGAVDFLPKPLRLPELTSKIQKALGALSP